MTATASINGRPYRRLRQWVLDTYDTCCACGQPVDKNLSGRHPRGPSLDHTLPRSRGGTNDKDNVRLAHLSCNSRMKDKKPKRNARRTSRAW